MGCRVLLGSPDLLLTPVPAAMTSEWGLQACATMPRLIPLRWYFNAINCSPCQSTHFISAEKLIYEQVKDKYFSDLAYGIGKAFSISPIF